MPNLPTSPLVAPADPNVEGVGSGMNAGGNNAGLGVSTGVVSPSGWAQTSNDGQTFNGQDIRNYVPGKTQYLGWGGDSVETGQQNADIVDGKLADYAGSDFNDQYVFVPYEIAQLPAAPGAAINAAGDLNATSETIPASRAGEYGWARRPVA